MTLRFNLNNILKDTNTSISELSRETDLSRKTLTQLSNNESKGIQLNTLEKLMNYFNEPIEKFFTDYNGDILGSIIKYDNNKSTLPIGIENDGSLYLLQLVLNFSPNGEIDSQPSYHAVPIYVNFFKSEHTGTGFWGVSVMSIPLKSALDRDKDNKKFTKQIRKQISDEIDIVKKTISELSEEQIMMLFLTVFSVVRKKDVGEISSEVTSLPFSIDFFGIKKIDFINVEKHGEEYEMKLSNGFKDDGKNNIDNPYFHLLQNTDLTTYFKNETNK